MLLLACLGLPRATSAQDQSRDYPYAPVPFTRVHVEGGFWAPRMEANRAVTVPYCFKKCEETGRIDNFAKAGGLMEGKFEGIYFNDSDVFKIVEGACYTLALQPDPELDAYLDKLIALFAAAQEDDGYLYTARTIDPENPGGAAKERWGNIMLNHELYNVGHMYEAAVAHFQVTGKRTFLDVAIKNADLIDHTFGPGKREDPPGHEEIEIGLVKLYRATGEERFLRLAKFFIDARGNEKGHKLYGLYFQDHKPVLEQDEAVGHAVRAGYLYSGMADVAALTGEPAYIAAIDRLWENIVGKKLYLTGGIGARHQGESFGDNFELPNRTAYCETCAAIAMALWNHRMFLLHGDAKFLDVLERILYNGFLSGISMTGDTFFYVNPLEAVSHARSPWFDCSCCPSNVVRFMPSIPGFAYAQRKDRLWVGLYIAGTAKVEMGGTPVQLRQTTQYPWDGAIRIDVTPEKPAEFALCLRVPGWAQGRPIASDLYAYVDGAPGEIALRVNGETAALDVENGFAQIMRTWHPDDVVELTLPLPVRRVQCNEAVEANRGRVALERGPVVFCAEGIDNEGHVLNIVLPDETTLEAAYRADLLGGVTAISGNAKALYRTEDGGVEQREQPFTAIPYYAWAHRGIGEMAVWLARTADVATAAPLPTIASKSAPSASHTHGGDTVLALNDQIEPKGSGDQSIPRHTWWDHRGTAEWVQYNFDGPQNVSAVEVYWFDDTGVGQCRVPASWKLLYRDGDAWKPVPGEPEFGVRRHKYNRAEFGPVNASALRIEAQLQDGFSGGLLEWKVE